MSVTVYNTDTAEIVTLSIIDPKSGCCWAADCIGNTSHGFNTVAPEGVSVDADYFGDSAQIEWWVEYLSKQESADNRLNAARQVCDNDQLAELDELISDVCGDIVDHPGQINAAIVEILGEDFEG